MFCADIIGPIVKRVMRALGIREEKSTNVHLEEQTFVCTGDDYELSFAPEAGKTYTVSVNGTVYEAEAKTAIIEGENVYLGNVGIVGLPGLEDTGEPWVILHGPGQSFSLFLWGDGTTQTVTLSIYEYTETTTPISDKYLPGPVVIDMNELGLMEAVVTILTTGQQGMYVDAPTDVFRNNQDKNNFLVKLNPGKKTYHIPAIFSSIGEHRVKMVECLCHHDDFGLLAIRINVLENEDGSLADRVHVNVEVLA